MPGHGYAVVESTPVGEVCALGTYNSGDNKLSCKMCLSGLTTADKGSTDASQCVTLPGWYISGYIMDGTNNTNELYSNTNGTDTNITSNSSGATVVSHEISRCPANTYNNGGNVATACTPCRNGTITRFDPSPWYGYYTMYNTGSSGNTEDICAPLVEHLPLNNATAGGQSYESYTTYSVNGSRYLWRWNAGPGGFDNGLLSASLRDAEASCTMLGGHLPSLHSLAQAEHLLGVHNSLWPRNSGWSREVGLWLGFFTHLGWNGGCEYNTEEIQGWGQYNPYNPYNQNGWIMSVPPEEIARRSPRAWSDWSAPDYPGMLLWSPQCEGRVLNVTRDVDSGRNITTFPSPRYYGRPYVCAFNYTPSEVASSSHAVMHGDRTFTLFTAQADFEAAASICASHGLQLASAHAANDNAALAGLAAQDRKWSGGHIGGSMLLGLRYNGAGTQAQAEHLLGVHNSLWPRNSGWSREVGLWLGFFTHLGWNGGCEYNTEEIQGWGQYNPYNPYNQNGWIMSVPPEEIARRSPRAWSDWSAPDYPGMLLWSPQCEGRVLNVTRDVDSGRNITTFPSPRYYGRPYVCAFNYTPSEVASSSHAVMHGDRTFTLFTAQADFEAAASICASHGLQLASAHAADDNAALAGLAAQDRKWSGGHIGGSMLLGLRYNGSSYAWQDGTDVDWAPDGFDLTQPPPAAPVTGYSRHCVVVLSNGSWAPISCTRQPASFACQRTASAVAAGECPPGFYLSDGGECTVCPAGSWCEGGAAPATPCAEGLTTILATASGPVDHCVTKPGFGYVIEANATYGTVCPVGTYNSAGNKLPCSPCPGSLTTAAAGSSEVASCGPLAEHLPVVNVTAGGQLHESYATYSGSRTRYLWRWNAGPGGFDNGLLSASLRDAEASCTMLGGHLPSLHSLAQAEHLLGVHNSLWPRNSGWSREVGLWLGFFTHLALAGLAAQDRKWSGGHIGGSMLLGLRYNGSSYAWQDGTDVDWAPDGFDLTQPPPAAPVTGYSRHCVVVLSNGSWAPISCTRQPASFACQRTASAVAAGECPPGFYLSDGGECTVCPAGSWCEGGAAPATPCAEGLTTILATASGPVDHCVTKPGFGYVIEANASYGTVCPVGTYNSAGNKLPCSPCPGSLTTAAAGSSEVASCGAQQGYYINNGGNTTSTTSILPCAVGTYQPAVAAVAQCIVCPMGSITMAGASTQAKDCNGTLPGWFVSGYATADDISSNSTSTLNNDTMQSPSGYTFNRCPADTFNNGGNLAASCAACPNGTVTKLDPGSEYSYMYYSYYKFARQHRGYVR
eukprot:jgi/Sobl393_1/9451/SZX66050.1